MRIHFVRKFLWIEKNKKSPNSAIFYLTVLSLRYKIIKYFSNSYMKQNQLDRIIKLVRRTGDRFVIMDKDTEETMVLMNLDEYENLLNDTSSLEELEEEDMLNRLNHDISRWRAQKGEPEPAHWCEPEEKKTFAHEVISEIEDNELEDDDLPKEEDASKIEEPHLEPIVEKLPDVGIIPEQSAQVEQTFGEENLSDLEDGEEEKFYLEPVE